MNPIEFRFSWSGWRDEKRGIVLFIKLAGWGYLSSEDMENWFKTLFRFDVEIKDDRGIATKLVILPVNGQKITIWCMFRYSKYNSWRGKLFVYASLSYGNDEKTKLTSPETIISIVDQVSRTTGTTQYGFQTFKSKKDGNVKAVHLSSYYLFYGQAFVWSSVCWCPICKQYNPRMQKSDPSD